MNNQYYFHGKYLFCLFQSGVMEMGQEKWDSREKSLDDENKELKHQIISLQRSLEEKDQRIRDLEATVINRMNNLNSTSTQVITETLY